MGATGVRMRACGGTASAQRVPRPAGLTRSAAYLIGYRDRLNFAINHLCYC